MSAHTMGPWIVLAEEADKPYIRIRGTALGQRFKVANVMTPAYEGVLPCEVEETRANARLIASAPEMLTALRMMIREFDYDHLCASERRAVDAAIAAVRKATGGEA